MDLSAFESDAMLAEFLDEARGNIEAVSRGLLDAERGQSSLDSINAMFRGAHSLKGLAGMFNLGDICRTTHALETVFDRLRKSEIACGPAVIVASFEAVDLLGGLLDDLSEKRSGGREVETVVRRLGGLVPAPASAPAQTAWSGMPESVLPVLAGVIASDLPTSGSAWVLRLPVQELLNRGRDLVHTWRELERLVQVVALVPMAGGEHSPWLPLDRFDYQIVMLVVVQGSLKEALAPLLLPRHDAWLLDLSRRSGRREVFHPAPAGAPGGDLRVKEDMSRHLPSWLAETGEELEGLDAAVLEIERSPDDSAALQAAFRFAHRIKGSAATMGLDGLARVAHNLEWALDLLRTGRLTCDAPAFQAIFAVKDWIAEAVTAVKEGRTTAPSADVIEAAFSLLGERSSPPQKTGRISRRWMPGKTAAEAAHAASATGRAVWTAEIEFRHDCRLADLRMRLMLAHLAGIGSVIEVEPSLTQLADADPPVRIVHLLLVSDAGEDAICACLQVDEVLRHELSPMEPEAHPPVVVLPAAPLPDPSPLEERPGKATRIPAEPAPPSVPRPALPVPISEATAIDARPAHGGDPSSVVAMVRVETGRLDHLMNTAGELVVAKARISGLSESLRHQLADQAIGDLRGVLAALHGASEHGKTVLGIGGERLGRALRWVEALPRLQATAGSLGEALISLHRTTSALQTSAMQMRMVPVAPLFQRFHRVVRDLCRDLGKQARLVSSGEGTELDKKLMDEMVDPLTHLIRNALDHGMETPAERTTAGKAPEGLLRLEAFHEGGQICLRVRDDGRGIDPARIRRKAIEKGVITAAQSGLMSDQEAIELIFLPGFSTAQQVSNVSGRGVGMDIVRSKITELKGTVEMESTVGAGSAITIRLPLTLAMVKALLVDIGGERQALPLDSVREIVEVPQSQVHEIEGGGRFIPLRDGIVAIADLPRAIGLRPLCRHSGSFRAVITKGGDEPMAIPVDAVLCEEEVVVKALPDEFLHVRGVAGSSILGDGRIALILDVATIVACCATSHEVFRA